MLSKFNWVPWNCPICKNSEKKWLGTRGGSTHRFKLGEEANVVRCKQCGLLFCDPFPVPKSMQEIYGDPKEYFRGYVSEEKVNDYKNLLKTFSKFGIKNNAKILDVGAGAGEFLAACNELGFDHAVGLEPVTAIANFAKDKYGVAIHEEELPAHADKHAKTYDCLVMSSVLEHVYDPDQLIASAQKTLRQGGYLFLELPNEPNLLTKLGNLFAALTRSKAVYNLSPTWGAYHVYGFSPKTLRLLLEKYGFAIEEIRVYSPASIPPGPGIAGKIKSQIGTWINKVANYTGQASNMTVWARQK